MYNSRFFILKLINFQKKAKKKGGMLIYQPTEPSLSLLVHTQRMCTKKSLINLNVN